MLPRDIWMALAAPSLASFESSISLVHLLTAILLALLSLRASPSMAWSPSLASGPSPLLTLKKDYVSFLLRILPWIPTASRIKLKILAWPCGICSPFLISHSSLCWPFLSPQRGIPSWKQPRRGNERGELPPLTLYI